jgi:hypothetical protein
MPATTTRTRGDRARGAMFFALFGALWLAGGYWLTHQGHAWVYGLIALIGAAILAAAVQAMRQQRPSRPALPDSPQQRRVKRRFHVINAAQWVLVVVGVDVLNNLGLVRWAIPFAILIVGLHFLPLARLFGSTAHYLIGAALALLAVSYPFVTGNPESPAGPFGAGLILWASALWALRPGAPARAGAARLSPGSPGSG